MVILRLILNFSNWFFGSVVLLLVSCQSSSLTQPHVVRMNIKDEPQTLDPRQARDLNSITLIRMLFEGLTRVGLNGQVDLALAEKMEISSDLKTVTFWLREAKWSNGDPVLASDFVDAWKRCLDPCFPSGMAFQLYVIKNARLAKAGKIPLEEVGIQALDRQTLQIQLEHPTPYLLHLLASPPFFPVHSQIDLEKGETIITNGPFSLDKWKHQNYLDIIKNDLYWDADHVQLTHLQLVMVQEDTELMMFEKQELDWVGSPLSSLPIEALAHLGKMNVLQSKEMMGTQFLRIHTESPPFNHIKMRQAFSLAIDRKSIVDHILQGNQIPATGLVPFAFKLKKGRYFEDKDISQARKLFQKALEELGVSPEIFSSVHLLYRPTERNHLIAQELQQQWFLAFGIRIQLEAIEGKVYFDRIAKQNYQLEMSSWIADFEDPINFLEVFKYKISNVNNTAWENDHFITLLDQSSYEIDLIKRYALLAEAEQILMNEMPIIPIFHHKMVYMNHPEIKDVALSHTGQLDFKWAYIDKTDKR